MQTKRFQKAVLLALLVLLFLSAILPASAQSASTGGAVTIRVAFYPLDGFFEYDADGNECGYGVDYLNKLSQYANIQWEYVPADSWEGIQGMLERGEADARMPATFSDAAAALYDFTVEPMMMSFHTIMTLRSREDLYYQDWATLSGIRIAICGDLLNKTGVKDYLDSIGVTANLVNFEDYNSCRAALDDGRVDALISNVMDLTQDMKVLDKFLVAENYITTLKGSPYYPLINKAMTQLHLEEPSFQSALYEQYFPDRAHEPFDRTESEFIASTDHLTVAVYPDRKPVSYLDENGVYSGIAIEMAELLSARIGIPFEYVPVTTATQTEMLATADLVMPVPVTVKSEDYFISADILEPEILMAVRDGVTELGEGARVGVLRTTPGILTTMEGLGTFDLVLYDTSRQALNALQAGDLDAFANSSYVLNWLLENLRYADLTTLRYQSFPLSYAISGRAEDTVLQSILEKAIRTISDQERAAIIQDGSKLSMDDFTADDRLYIYRVPILFAIIILAVLLLFALIYNTSRTRYIQRIEESSRQQEQASRAKSDFLARMSHDMRTPLNVIMGMSRLAQDNDNPPDTNACLSKIDVSGEFLLGLINDVLDMEHIESGKLTLKLVPYSASAFKRYIGAVIRPLCDQKGIRFDYTYDGPDDFVILQDKLRINQIYFNLLSNAVKFTPEGGSIRFHTHIQPTDHGTLCLDVTIADTGIGMSPAFMEHMFEPFSQENREVRPLSEGTGLGLSIVKRICDLMDMRISATSEPGKGTTFTLHGEYAIAKDGAAEEGPVAAADPARLRGRTILVCEDHPLNQEIIERLLTKKGAISVLAGDGKRGLEIFSHAAPDTFAAVLMDVRMPVMDGLEAARSIRALPRPDAQTVPIIALTANAYEEDVRKCLAAGMDAHLAKPIDPARLYETLAAHIKA